MEIYYISDDVDDDIGSGAAQKFEPHIWKA